MVFLTSIKGSSSVEKQRYWSIFFLNLALVNINMIPKFDQNPPTRSQVLNNNDKKKQQKKNN